MRYFKVFGAERTGTLYLKALFDENIHNTCMFTNLFGSRHELPLNISGVKEWTARNKRVIASKSTGMLVKMIRGQMQLCPIIIIKDPYTWYKSINRWRRGRGIDMEGEYAMYNKMYRGCKHFIENTKDYGKIYTNCMFIRYEDLLRIPTNVIKKVSNFYEIPTPDIRNPLIIPDKVPNSNKFTKKSKEIYLSAGPYKIDTNVINQITSLIDWSVIGNFFGYYPMDPRDFHELGRRSHTQLTVEMRKNEIIPTLSKYGADRRVGVRNRPIF